MSGGKDGVVCLWDENLSRCLKTYKLNKASLAAGQPKDVLVHDNAAIRALTLGQGKILVGTKNGEVNNIINTVLKLLLHLCCSVHGTIHSTLFHSLFKIDL